MQRKKSKSKGLPLSPKDKMHAILKGRKLGISLPRIAEALNMSKEEIDNLKVRNAG